MASSGAATFGNMPKRNGYRGRRQRKIDEEYPAPGGVLDQPAAQNGPNRGSDRREPGPRADRLTSAFLVEGCTDNRQAAGHKECGADTLNASCNDQLMYIRRKPAARGR